MSKTQKLIDNPDAELDAVTEAAPVENPNLKTVELDDHIVRGNTIIDSVDIRKPVTGELRGVSLLDLSQMDVAALRKVLPRITLPSLTDAEIGSMSPADIMQCGIVVTGFLIPKKLQSDYPGA